MSIDTDELQEFRRFLEERIAAGDVKNVSDFMQRWEAVTEIEDGASLRRSALEIQAALDDLANDPNPLSLDDFFREFESRHGLAR